MATNHAAGAAAPAGEAQAPPAGLVQELTNFGATAWACKAGAHFLLQVADVLTEYEKTKTLPDTITVDLTTSVASPRKRGKAKKGPKLNKDGSVKQPRKPTAYNAWMQAKLKELKERSDHDPAEKHVDTFKQATQIWAAMSDEEKKKITEDFKHQQEAGEAAGNVNVAHVDVNTDPGAVIVPPPSETSEDEDEESSSEEEEAAPAPIPVPVPKPAPASTAAPAAAQAVEAHKKKKKRKSEAPPAPTPVAESEKKKKKKKKDKQEA